MLRFRGSKADLKRSLKLLPHVLAGLHPDPHGLHALFWGHVGNGALDIVRADYLAKLAGGVGAFDGVRWAQLAVATLAKRKREGRDDSKILYETGDLLNSLVSGTDGNPSDFAPDQVFRVHRDGVEVGSADRTIDRHQRGTDRMPARPVIPTGAVPFAWERELEKVCEKALVKTVERLVEVGGIK